MFVPRMYREPEPQWIQELVRRNPLALLLTNGDDREGPFGTHLPVIIETDPAAQSSPDLTGTTLLGHMNRANPQWKALCAGIPAVLSFAGPHGYVSPTLYPSVPAAPTWNYTAAQLRGVLEPIESEEETLSVVRATAGALETEFGNGWDMTDSMDHFRRILPGVGAFRFTVTRSAAIFKLSQEQNRETQGRVCRHFQEAAGGQPEVAEYMSRLTESN
ncbi:FMN-binding negative transcriptional regulator [Micromonospora sp. HNM0581]|uniref:FMN-binding negative transcriptional regulator n=1 Tax=Micromonospora sp. HNM0581 TaxID=2716341 RepID=UPI00146D8857|nr:FMN-binding negative transcriptional regulator [Micromonospora sp. HNM0581]NLU79274.1 FMN-binding negative transcriptional regulator [Micromonospora sp. HNM0581]